MVIIISGILVSVALRSVVTVTETGRIEETKQELEALAVALVGNPELENNGVRTDFGYVGDIGALPSGLDSLFNRPTGGYTTWNGPYIKRRFTQITNDYGEDAWGVAYTYAGGVDITSTGSGSNIVRKIANASSDLLGNEVTGIVLDRNGAPPGSVNTDSVTIFIEYPDGIGGTTIDSVHPDASGYFSFSSIPIGNHDLGIVYNPLTDTLARFVSVLPNSVLYQEYFLTFNPWSTIPPTEGCIEYVAGSARAYSPGANDCSGMEFKLVNSCGMWVFITSILLDYLSTPVAYYQTVKWQNEAVFSGVPERAGSGELVDFEEPYAEESVAAGDTVTVLVDGFRDTRTPGVGNFVDMDNLDVTITLSDGSVISFNTGDCP